MKTKRIRSKNLTERLHPATSNSNGTNHQMAGISKVHLPLRFIKCNSLIHYLISQSAVDSVSTAVKLKSERLTQNRFCA
jgi:hypothetical protein